MLVFFFFFQAEDGIRDLVRSRGLGDVYKRQILGKGLADKLLANLGDVVQLTTAQGERFSLKVVGFFQSGIAEYDKVQSYASIATTQKVLGKTKNYITDIQIKLHNVNEAIGLAKEYEKLFDTDAEDIPVSYTHLTLPTSDLV